MLNIDILFRMHEHKLNPKGNRIVASYITRRPGQKQHCGFCSTLWVVKWHSVFLWRQWGLSLPRKGFIMFFARWCNSLMKYDCNKKTWPKAPLKWRLQVKQRSELLIHTGCFIIHVDIVYPLWFQSVGMNKFFKMNWLQGASCTSIMRACYEKKYWYSLSKKVTLHENPKFFHFVLTSWGRSANLKTTSCLFSCQPDAPVWCSVVLMEILSIVF